MKSEHRLMSIPKRIFTIIFSIIFLIIQLILYYIVFFGINELKDFQYIYDIIYYTVQIIGIIIVLSIYGRTMNTGYKLSWTIFILLAPFLGTMSYLLFGNQRSISYKRTIKVEHYLEEFRPNDSTEELLKARDPITYKFIKSIYNNSSFPPYINTNVKFYNDALNKSIDMLNDMRKAEKYIFMEYFIIANGALLDEIIEIIRNRAKNGVIIKILYDDVGSKQVLKNKTIKALKEIENVSLYSYEPLGITINPAINYRDHRKMTIIDGKIAYCGGDNIADEYVHKIEKYGFWRDNAIRLEGDAVKSFVVLFATTWYMSSKIKLDIEKYQQPSFIKNDSLVIPFGDGPINKKNPSYELFMNMINNATKYIYISTPYFIIDSQMLEAIARQARNGVDVKILIPGIPDKQLVYLMSCSHFESILKAGGEIYELKDGFNHAKNVIIDGAYAFIGTVNMDYRSFFLHFECGCLLAYDKVVVEMQDDFLKAIGYSRIYTYEEYKRRNPFVKLFQLFLKILSPLL